jgi:hypothetical protein
VYKKICRIKEKETNRWINFSMFRNIKMNEGLFPPFMPERLIWNRKENFEYLRIIVEKYRRKTMKDLLVHI